MSAGLVLYVVRHGQTQWNVAGRMQGRLDSALTARGEAQADAHGRTLAALGGVDELLVSPLGRTRATADLVNAHVGAPVRVEPALVERDCGAWSGLTVDEIATRYPQDWRHRLDDPYHHRPPEGENLPDMELRAAGLLEALRRELHVPRRLALVTHGVMSRVIVKCLMDLSPDEATLVRHPNELFYRLEWHDGEAAVASHFIEGAGPHRGLLRHQGDGTIPGWHTNGKD